MRIPGLGGQVLAKLGASTVSLPGGQIYENLVSGTIDATEWVGPYNDYFMKFYEAAKYYYTGGMHEPGAQLSLDLEQVVVVGPHRLASRRSSPPPALEENANSYFESMALNGEYLQQARRRARRRGPLVQRRRLGRHGRSRRGGVRGDRAPTTRSPPR